MTLFQVLQALILAVLLMGCSLGVVRKLLPGVWQALFAAASRALARHGQTRLARRLEPTFAPTGGCGGGGCPSCSGCALKARISAVQQQQVGEPATDQRL